MPPTTRDRIVETSASLLRRQGYIGTGVKQIAAEADATFGRAVPPLSRRQGRSRRPGDPRLGRALRAADPGYVRRRPRRRHSRAGLLRGAAEHLVQTDYADACPIATVALEVSSIERVTARGMRQVFSAGSRPATERFVAAGIARRAVPGELTVGMLAALEGALRPRPSGARHRPLRVAGEVAAPRSRPRSPAPLARHATALGTRLARGAARRGDPEHAHRLQAERQLLAAVGRGDVEAGELAHALEPVADRVAVGDRAAPRSR